MIHPHTEIRFIGDSIGYGIFATQCIPAGTIVYVQDPLEHIITPDIFRQYSEDMQRIIEKYSYINEHGHRILSWDLAKYVNHCCRCNTISTGYGFEIAIRDIEAGEEITDEYGLFNLEQPMIVACQQPGCRGVVCQEDIQHYAPLWDRWIQRVLPLILDLEQPLLPFVEDDTLLALIDYLIDQKQYRSVALLSSAQVSQVSQVVQDLGRSSMPSPCSPTPELDDQSHAVS